MAPRREQQERVRLPIRFPEPARTRPVLSRQHLGSRSPVRVVTPSSDSWLPGCDFLVYLALPARESDREGVNRHPHRDGLQEISVPPRSASPEASSLSFRRSPPTRLGLTRPPRPLGLANVSSLPLRIFTLRASRWAASWRPVIPWRFALSVGMREPAASVTDADALWQLRSRLLKLAPRPDSRIFPSQPLQSPSAERPPRPFLVRRAPARRCCSAASASLQTGR